MTLFDLADMTPDNNAGDYSEDFQTPPDVCAYMASMIPWNCYTVLEPTPGIGNLVKAISPTCEVTAPLDYFKLPPGRFDCVVMNPPFSAKSTILQNAPTGKDFSGMKMGYWFLTECMERSDNVIALMPWFTLSDSDVRMRFLKEWGLKSITALPRKTFQYARIQTVVLQLQKGYKGPTEFKVFELLNNPFK